LIDAIIFDAEGVVVDTEPLWDRGQEEFLRRRGCAYDRDTLKHLLTGCSLVEGVRVMQREFGFGGDAEALARERKAIVRDLFAQEARFVEGFPEFFERVREQYKTCIATAMDEELLSLVDGHLGLGALFPGTIFTLAHVGNRGKPHPDLFLHAARRLGSLPETCLVIEDAPHGVKAARQAGMRCVALTTTYDPEKLGEADAIVNSFAEIDPAAW
jgi:HAD superfamily hydrolase (TIGR01509 family)